MSAPLALTGAGLRFGSRFLWRDVDLTVQEGEFIAVLGPNGTGKTTLLRTALGLQPLSEGEVSVFGRRPARGDRRIGYIPQQRLLDSATPVRGSDLVGFGVDGGRFGLPIRRRADRDRIARIVDDVGAHGFADRSAWRLSGGEQQRLRVGQAIADDPRLLLCDEPLISLDLANQAAVSALIDRQRTDHGAAVLFVTHDVNPVLDLVDRVLYLVGGRFRIGTPEEVLNSAVLSELYGARIDVVHVGDRVLVVGANSGHEEHEHPQVPR